MVIKDVSFEEVERIREFLKESGFYYSHIIDGYDEHYYGEEGIEFDVIFDSHEREFAAYPRVDNLCFTGNPIVFLQAEDVTYDNIKKQIEKLSRNT